MKTSIVPAQITTVEDKIAGNLTLQQLALLIVPFLAGFLVFIILPPNLQFVLYKFAIVGVLFILCGLLALRIKGVMVLFWIAAMLRYNTRPRYYVYDKTDPYLRESAEEIAVEVAKSDTKTVAQQEQATAPIIETADRVKFEQIMRDPQAAFRFRTGKDGKLNVVIKEIK